MNGLDVATALGQMRLVGDHRGLRQLAFLQLELEAPVSDPVDGGMENEACLMRAAIQLQAYAAGRLTEFDVRLNPQGTDFQQRVWQALLAIPYGEVRSYKDIALAIGQPKAVRAVGGAIGQNPIPLMIPCHRVVGADGSLTGFRWGLALKKRLLQLEGGLSRL